MSVEDTIKVFDEYGFDKFIVDSDMSYAPSNPMSLANLKHELEVNGYPKEDIDKVMYKNFMKFHNMKSL
jgi:predicted metal-dependent TIM-barrel fold hydrolase